MRAHNILLACVVGLVCLLSPPLAAQSWPTKPVRIIVPFGAGGTADILARLVGESLSPALGQPVVVENRPGAGGNVGASLVAHAEPDGYTLLMGGLPTHSLGPYLFAHLSYDPMRDVPPVAMIAVAPNLLVVNSTLPVKSVVDLVTLARAKPGHLTYASAGTGTSGYLAAELLKSRAHLQMSHVPYKGGPEAVSGVLSGDVDFLFFTVPALLPLVKTGKLRALAITSAKRSPLVPDVPTVAEQGFPGFEALGWFALFAPRNTPKPIVSRLGGEIEKICALPGMREKLIRLGAEPRFMDAAQLTKFIAAGSPLWGKLIREAGIKAD